MEANFTNDAKSTTIISQEKLNHGGKKRRRRSNFLKAALYFIRHGSRTSKTAQVDVASKDAWKNVVGSMRPMHMQANQSPPPSINKRGDDRSMKAISSTPHSSSIYMSSPSSSQYASTENLQELVRSNSFYQASPSSSSQYASCQNLQELISQTDESAEHEVHPDGDEMIDAKADMFIAQFYERMRLERHY